MHFGWIFSDGYFVTSTFSLRRANSTNPDPAIPAQIVNPNVFVGFGALGCTTTTTCPKPADTGIEDGDVNTEGGQPPT